MTSEPILVHYDDNKPITLETDASDYGIGVVCSQPDHNGILHPLGFYSRQLKPAELNYDIHDKELLAVVEGLAKWDKHCRTNPGPITILTDHKNLEYWKAKRDLNLRQARWSEKLANYNFVIKYRPGKLCGKPDILSRESGDSRWEGDMKHRQNKNRNVLCDKHFSTSADTPNDTPDNSLDISVNVIDETKYQPNHELVKKITERKNNDKEMLEIIKLVEEGTRKNNKVALGLCEYQNGLLTYDGLIWIPNNDELRLEILKQHHDHELAGHPGRERTLELIKRNFYWPQQRQYVNRYVDNCDTCRRIKPTRHAPFGLLKPLKPPDRPWNSLSMDFVTGLPKARGSDINAIWVVVDRMTKMAHFVPVPDTITPEGLAKVFLGYIFKYHGLPKEIISDRGSVFTSRFWTEITRLLKIKKNLSTAYHPETDGRRNELMQLWNSTYARTVTISRTTGKNC